MSIFSTISKFVLFQWSDSKTKKDTKIAHQTAFANTGKKIKVAKKKKKYIDGKAVYQAEYNKQMKKVNENAKTRENLISSL